MSQVVTDRPILKSSTVECEGFLLETLQAFSLRVLYVVSRLIVRAEPVVRDFLRYFLLLKIRFSSDGGTFRSFRVRSSTALPEATYETG